MLAAASVADDFDLDLLAALTDMTAAEVADGLGEALEARLVVIDDDGYRFAHTLIRETLLDTQPAGRRAELHQRAATALEARLDRLPLEARAALAGAGRRPLGPGPGRGRPRAARLAVDGRAERSQPSSPTTTPPASTSGRGTSATTACDTLTELGEAQVLAGQPRRGPPRRWPRPRRRAVTERRGEALARAVLAAGSGVGGYEVDVRDEQQVPRLRDALSLLGDDDSRLRSAALARTALVDTSLTVEVTRRARRRRRRHGGPGPRHRRGGRGARRPLRHPVGTRPRG